MTTMSLTRPWLGLAAGAAALALVSATGYAADASKEVQTAITHAGYAADATVLRTVHTHLHHVVNCLVGPKGKGFSTKFADPCKGQGNGAIPDTADAAKKKTLETALASAMTGIKSRKLADAKAAATKTGTILRQAE